MLPSCVRRPGLNSPMSSNRTLILSSPPATLSLPFGRFMSITRLAPGASKKTCVIALSTDSSVFLASLKACSPWPSCITGVIMFTAMSAEAIIIAITTIVVITSPFMLSFRSDYYLFLVCQVLLYHQLELAAPVEASRKVERVVAQRKFHGVSRFCDYHERLQYCAVLGYLRHSAVKDRTSATCDWYYEFVAGYFLRHFYRVRLRGHCLYVAEIRA